MTEKKVCAWLQDDVLQRTLGPRNARGTRGPAGKRRLSKKGKELVALAESYDDDLELDPEMEPDPGSDSGSDTAVAVEGRGLGYATVKVYVAAIAELYRHQVSAGLNRHPNFRGPGLKGLMVDLERTQALRADAAFEDRGVGGAQGGYTEEEFLRMQELMLSSIDCSRDAMLHQGAQHHNWVQQEIGGIKATVNAMARGQIQFQMTGTGAFVVGAGQQLQPDQVSLASFLLYNLFPLFISIEAS